MRSACSVSSCVPRFRGSPSNHEPDNDASTLGRESTLLSDLRPVKRPNVAVLVWRWRWELMLGVGLPTAVVIIGTRLGWALPLATLGVVGGTFTASLAARRWLTAHIRCIIIAHRIRTGCAHAWLQTRYGKLPIILLTSPQSVGERAYIWCRAGISVEDFEGVRDILRSACWASDIRVVSSYRYSHIVILDIIRYGCTE
jgi:hypothetical protein